MQKMSWKDYESASVSQGFIFVDIQTSRFHETLPDPIVTIFVIQKHCFQKTHADRS